MKIFLTLILAGLLAGTSVQAADAKKKVSDFTLEDYNGAKHSLSDYKSARVIVLMFIATQCPISNDYNKRMVDLSNDYTSKGVVFLGINSNKQESIEEIKEHSGKNNFEFTVLKDKNNVIADRLEASVTPEIFVLNNKYDILYHGRIDDSRKQGKVTTNDLRTALDEILSGKPVGTSETKAFGCTIKRIK